MSIQQRINFVSSKVLNLPELSNSLELFVCQLSDFPLEIKCKITYLYLVLLARYPSLEELEEISFQNRFQSLNEIAIAIQQSKEFKNLLRNKNAQYSLVEAEDEYIYLDASETLFSLFNTGVQRVTRSFFQNAMALSSKVCFFATLGNPLRPYILRSEELKRIRNWQETSLFQKEELISWRNLYKTFFREGFVNDCVVLIKRTLQNKIFNLCYSPKGSIQIPVFKDNTNIFLAEVLLKKGRVSLYESLKHTFNNLNLSMIFYDLLPLVRAEFFDKTVTAAFAEYIKLFRFVNRVSCISSAVHSDLEAFLKCLSLKSMPIIKTHLLAVCENNNLNDSLDQQETVPFILSVGTIEPRKNQLKLIRAASLLWDKGFSFKLYFVGTLGWNSAAFLDEIKKTEKKYPDLLKYLNHVDELTLNKLYKNAKATVFISLAEGFGLPLLESLSSSTPCITTNYGSTREIANLSGGCILVDPLSLDEIYSSIEMILTNEEEYSKLKQEAENFRWHSWKDYTLEVLEFSLSGSLVQKS